MTNGICRSLWIVKLETYHGALVTERKNLDWSLWIIFVFDGLDPIKQQYSTPCIRAIQLARFIFAVGFYSLSSKVRLIRNWHSLLMKRGSLAGIHKYADYPPLEFTEPTSNPRSPAPSSESWWLWCCEWKWGLLGLCFNKKLIAKDMYTSFSGIFFSELTEERYYGWFQQANRGKNFL
jgi:hypothetical protein